jgi:hypothetical protein
MSKGWNAADRADARRYLYNMFRSSARDTPSNISAGLLTNWSTRSWTPIRLRGWQSLHPDSQFRSVAQLMHQTKKGPMAIGHRAILGLRNYGEPS